MAIDNKPLYMEHLGYTAARDQQMIAMLVGFRYGDDTGTVGISGANDYTLTAIESTPQYGVFPPLDNLKVHMPGGNLTGLTFLVSPGVCSLPFTSSLGTFDSENDGGGTTTEPRAILAAINGSNFSGTLNSATGSTRIDLVYAKADTRNITTSVWSRTGTTATITTGATVHGYRVGDTVTIVTTAGATAPADGTYTITAVTASTFTITTAASGTVTAASITGKACVPFSIGVVEGTLGGSSIPTVPADEIGIPLASITVSGSAISAVVDRRQFVSSLGGVHYYENNSNPQFKYNGKLEYNVSQGLLYLYDKSTQATTKSTTGLKLLYKADTGHHDTVPTDHSTAALHHTLGTGENQAASGNHTHEGLALVRPTRLWATTQGMVGNPAVSIGLSGTQELSGIYLEDNEPKFSLNSGTGGIFALKKSANKSIKSGRVTVDDAWTLVNDSDDSYLYYNNFTITDAGVAQSDTVILTAEYDSGAPSVGPLIAHILSVSSGSISARVSTLPKFTITGGGNDIDFNTTVPTLVVKVHYMILPQSTSSGEYHMWEKT